MTTTTDGRAYIRQPRAERIVLQIVLSAHGTLPPGTVVRCSTKDISPRGIRIQLNRPLSEGSLLELGVEISNRPGIFFLSGEVKWCQVHDESKRNLVGVEIKKGPFDDFKRWQETVNRWSPFKSDFKRA